jgi:hypothetical protein
MTKEEQFDAVLNGYLGKDGLGPVCIVCENDHCPEYDPEVTNISWEVYKNRQCWGFRPIEGWDEAYEARLKKESEEFGDEDLY